MIYDFRMKRKFILTGSLVLLLALILFMAWDMFYNKPQDNVNPYAYDLKSFKSGDTSLILYSEVRHITPGLSVLHGIALDRSDHIYICGENKVEIYDPAGRLDNEFPIEGTAQCIQVAADGKIYLGMQDHLEIFDHRGMLLKKWKSFGDKSIITSIAVTDKYVFIADAGNKVAWVYDLSGHFLKKTGEKDPEKGIPGFVIPSPYFDLGMGRNGELWIVNPGRHRLEKYNYDGDLISSWGAASMTMEGFCGCCNPSDFAMLSDGSFVTSEKGIERIKLYWPDGTFRGVVAGPDAFIEGTRGLDLAVDSKDHIFVLDPEKKQVREFAVKNQK
jgi:hypothetical protein